MLERAAAKLKTLKPKVPSLPLPLPLTLPLTRPLPLTKVPALEELRKKLFKSKRTRPPSKARAL